VGRAGSRLWVEGCGVQDVGGGVQDVGCGVCSAVRGVRWARKRKSAPTSPAGTARHLIELAANQRGLDVRNSYP
jgi:hypothetical protein